MGMTYDSLEQLFIFLILASGLAILGSTRVRRALGWWTFQALFLSTLIFFHGWRWHELEVLIIAGVSLAIKGGIIPWLLKRVLNHSNTEWVGEVFLKRTSSLVAASALTLLAYLITQPLLNLIQPAIRNELAVAFSLLFYGLLVLIGRKVALVQVLGILLLDNGIFLAGFLLTNGMPILVEIGVSFDILLGAVILGILARNMIENYDSLNVEHLNSLKG